MDNQEAECSFGLNEKTSSRPGNSISVEREKTWSIYQMWYIYCKMFSILIETCYGKFARLTAKRPFAVLFGSLFIAILLASGFLTIHRESSVRFLFLPEDTQASKDLKTAAKNGFELDVRQEEVIILPQKSKHVLSRDCLSEMIDMHFAIVQTDGYENNCFRSEGSGNCISINLLEIFDYNKTKLDDISTRIQTVLKNTSYLMSNGRRLIDNQFVILDRRSQNITKTRALRMVYFMTEHKKGNKRENILRWEKKFIEIISLLSKTTRCANVYVAAERSLDDSVSESTASGTKLFLITLTVMAIFSSIVNGRCFDFRYGHQLLGFASLLALYLGIASGFGISMYVGVPFVSMISVLPFLVVSIGVDDVFIILHELNDIIHENTPAVNTLIGCMARSGPTITMTTLTDLVAFAVSSRSTFPAVRYFCGYAALAITFAFLLLVTFFVACIWFDIERINALRLDFIPCFKTRISPGKNCRTNRQHFSFLNNFMKSWAKMLMTGPGKAIVCLLSFVLLAGGIYGAVNVNQEFSRHLLTTKGSDYKEFLTVSEEHFSLQFAVSVIVPGQLDYSSPEVQQKYLDLENIAKSNKYFIPVTLSWMSKFLHWAEVNKALTNESRYFYSSLQRFLTLPEYGTFVQDIRFSKSKNQTRIASSRIIAFSKSSLSSVFHRDMTSSIRSDLSQHSSLDVFPITLSFIYFDQYARILDETIQNLLKAGIAILVVTLVFLSHPMAVLVLLFGFVALIFELFGLMYIWDLSLNAITMIILVMALGFSVDYSAHVAYHFISSDALSPELRIVDSLETIGGSVLLGGVSTFLGMLAMGFASTVIFQIFFKMFMGIIIFGLLHGLVILPVYLSLLAKLFDFKHATSYTDYLKNRKPRKRACNTKNIENQAIFKQSQVRKHNPIAVVGISCRFGQKVNSKDGFWSMLVEGNCGIGPFLKNKLGGMDMNNSPGLVLGALTGAYMDEMSGFDAEFFGISPAECRALDPQQKLLLQIIYEATEDAGLRIEDLQQCQTGVYVGLMKVDGYGRLLPDDTAKIAEFASIGCTASTSSSRISLLLNLTGPSLTVDTACSSSLTALNIAITHLNTSECEVAIVCASNIILPRVLAKDGRCKGFEIKGVGYGRGEGMAAVILKETSVALLDRNDAYAEIVACGLDNDGQNATPRYTHSDNIVACGLDNDGQNATPRTTPSAEIVACGLDNDGQNAIPLTTPSNKMQTELPRRVLLESGLSKEDVQYIEVHGTGTAIEDVVEMQSISSVYGNSSARVLRVGSVKPNINQTEPVAGLAGLIKVCLMVKQGYFVPTINVDESEPELKIPEREMMVQVKYEPWKKDNNKPRTAAVCCYGYGCANAIIREVVHMPEPVIPGQFRTNRIMTLSAHSTVALKVMAKRFSTWIEMRTDDDEVPDLVDDICYTLNDRRTVHLHRLAVTFRQLKQAATVMKMFGEDTPGWKNQFISVGKTNSAAQKLAFIYGGQENRWYGMARKMIEQETKFRESIEKIDDVLRGLGVSWCLMDEMRKSKNVSRMQEDPIGQTAVFATHYAMTELLKYWKILPDAVVGHSLGEISAACTANVLTLKQALKLVLLRSRLHESCSLAHRMVAVGMSVDEATALIEGLELDDRVNVAVINSPKNVVLSGDTESMQAIKTHVQQHHANVLWKALGTTQAFHNKEMEDIKQLFMKGFERIKVTASQEKVAFYSTVTGTQLPGRVLSSADHWWKNVRQPVLFCSAIEKMISDGYKLLVEINATPQLARHVHDIFSCCQKKATPESEVSVIKTLPKRRVKEQHMSFLHNCPATLFTRGYPISWDKIQGSGSKSFIRCPTYPWQEGKFWYRESGPQGILATTKQILVKEVEPKRNRSMIINDILKPTEDFEKEKETQAYDNSDSQQQSISHSNVSNKISPSDSESVFSGLELENVNIATKVTPLYVPDDAVVKVFMIDASHKSALANAPFAAGFRHQTKVSLYSIGVDNSCKTLDYGSVRDLAKQYVKLIKAQQLRGPYYLAGFSFGGTLSIEVASQLIEQSEEVAMLVMLDTLGWFPKSLTHTRQLFTNYQELLIKDLQQTASKHLLKKLGTRRLGYTSEKFGQLIDELGMGEQLFSVMETRAKEQNITLDDLRNHVRTLEQQIKRDALAQLDWQPPKIHYQKTITYLRCQDSFERKPPLFVWSATDSWKCLTNEIDIFSVAGSHFDLPDQPYAKTCGSIIMTTASITHRTQYNSFQKTEQRSLHEERLLDWLKQAVDIGYSSGDILNFKPGKLWLHENEISLTIWFKRCGLGEQRVINVTDIHNVVPGKYVYALRKKSSGKQGLSLTISLIAGQNKLYHVRCLDWQKRDKLMGAFEVLLGTPILKFDHPA